MKTLKRTMALVLALVMCLGVLTIGAGAYNDDDSITYKDAVNTMTELKVLDGYPNGNFKPEGNVTRAEAAKFFTYLALGSKYADAMTGGSQVFDDVDEKHWAVAYIDYAANAGILNGKGNNLYDPEGDVTGIEFAKGLLCILGYGKNNEFVGPNWAVNTMQLAFDKNINVFKNNTDGANQSPASREEISLYGYNIMNVPMVKYDANTKQYEFINLAKDPANDPIEYKTLAETAFDLEGIEEPIVFSKGKFTVDGYEVKASIYDVGRVAKISVLDDKVIGEYSFTDKIITTSYSDVALLDMVNSNHKDFVVTATGRTEYLNGIKGGDADDAATVLGGEVVFITTDNNKKNADTVLGFLPTVYVMTGAPTERTSGGKTLVTYPGVSGINGVEETYVFCDDDDLAKDDVVTVIKNGDYFFVEKVTKTVEGKIAAKTSDDKQVTIDGTKYKVSGLPGSVKKFEQAAGDTVELYLDKGGNVVHSVATDEIDALNGEIVYVLDTEAIGSGISNKTYKALVINKKAEVSELDINKASFGRVNPGEFVKIQKKSGLFDLTAETIKVSRTGAKVVNSSSDVFDLGANNVIATTKTVFVVKTTDTKDRETYKAYTGFKDIPEFAQGADGANVDYLHNGTTISFVYIENGEDAIDADAEGTQKVVVILDSVFNSYPESGDDPAYDLYDAVVDGAKTTIKVASNRTNGALAKNDVVVGVFDDKDFVTLYDPINVHTDEATNDYDGGTVKLAYAAATGKIIDAGLAGTVFGVCTSSTKVYTIKDKKVSATTDADEYEFDAKDRDGDYIADGDYVIVYELDDSMIKNTSASTGEIAAIYYFAN